MRNFVLPKPPGAGPQWYVVSVAFHVVFLGALVWVSTHTRDTYGVTHLIRLYEGSDVRQFTMRVPDPLGTGTTQRSPGALSGFGRVSIAAVPVDRARPGARAPARDPRMLSIGIPGASTIIPGAIVVGTRRRIGPAFGDGRLWEDVILGAVGAEGEQVWGDDETEMALIVAGMLSSIIEDSLVVRGGVPNWVTTIGGQQWGIDPEFIHLGPIKIPTVLAALLGFAQLPQMGNYELAQQQQWLADVRYQILNQAQRMDQMDSFRRNVRSMEARKLKEREEERRRRAIVAAQDSIIGRF